MKRRFLIFVLFLSLALFGCSSEEEGSSDAISTADSSAMDTSTTDSSTLDTSTTDSSAMDTSPADSSTLDTSTTNAGDVAGGTCSSDEDCERGTICESLSCAVIDCADRGDCGTNRICLNEGVCSAIECLTADNCGDGQSCTHQICVEAGAGGCMTPEDCSATNQICNPISQTCEAPHPDGDCVQNWQCVHPQTCNMDTGTCG